MNLGSSNPITNNQPLITCGVLRVYSDCHCWVIPASRGQWLPAGVSHRVQSVGAVKVCRLLLDPLARADLPSRSGMVQITPLLHALIVTATQITASVDKGSREERICELILDELRGLSQQDFTVPLPEDQLLLTLCQHITARIAHPWSLTDAAKILHVSERTVSRKFHQASASVSG
ncbi:AraC family transcriptional regulator [Shewanella sp. YLB-07]|uniref:AraC family transcriptional regulator n=1 Tax=Shewanella sp. YLB-07 TaxID=2601268 RepID=UPI00128C4D95|nr:AraC family transcriptional regulator [Shewanella sp. YLB-07]MPY24347.1 helix-turn-helix transcriptional regulator [Shewanella sp. YLB-07]